jgi:undecaprenyl-diphosphatase
MEELLNLDTRAFLFLNNLGSPALDPWMNRVSGELFWAPLYLFLLWQLYRLYGLRVWAWLVLAIALLVTLTDQGSVHLFKDVFQRLRPCHEPGLEGLFRLAKASGCGGQFGFVSSHAANTAGLAVAVGLWLRPQFNYAIYLLLVWSALVSFSRIYLGVHYPGDVLAGSIFGAMVGYLVYKTTRDYWPIFTTRS